MKRDEDGVRFAAAMVTRLACMCKSREEALGLFLAEVAAEDPADAVMLGRELPREFLRMDRRAAHAKALRLQKTGVVTGATTRRPPYWWSKYRRRC